MYDRVLAVDKRGNLSYCYAKPENRGHGNCPHIAHARDGETNENFLKRMSRQEALASNKNFKYCMQLYEKEMNKKYTLKFSESSLGDDVEDSIYDKIVTSFGEEYKVRKSNVIEDLFEGTDMFIDGIRVDITLNDEKKGTLKFIESAQFKNVKVDFSVRTGNGRNEFNEPVVVIRFETNVPITKRNCDSFVQNKIDIYELQDIMGRIFDAYCKHLDEEEDQ